MRRALVLTDETRRHPFRANLPAQSLDSGEAGTAGQYWRRQLTRRDWRDIAATYVGTFAAVTVFFS
jgi:hypothetical protein